VRTIDALLDEHALDVAMVRFIKIDVEGSEVDVLAGAKRVLAGSPLVMAEANTPVHARALSEHMAASGYRVAAVTDGRNIIFERADARP